MAGQPRARPGLLREAYTPNPRTLPEHVPIGFVRQKGLAGT